MMPMPAHRQAGLSLVELMVSITIGLMIMAGVLFVFANSSKTRTEMEKTARQIESGSYAMQLLRQDVGLAGYFGELPRTPAGPASLPDPCATDLTSLQGAMGVHLQGYDNGSTIPSCLSDVKAGTDILVVRRAASCSSANPLDANCDAPVAGAWYLQVSGCSGDPAPTAPSVQTIQPYLLLSDDTSSLTLKKIGCTAAARVVRYRTHIYFIANNNVSGDGIPTLKRWELGTGIVPLVEGIENLQVEYGIDAQPAQPDGVPESFNAAPPGVTDWANVMAVDLHVLARNSTVSGGYQDTRTYSLGRNADGSANTAGPFNDAYKRHVFASMVRLANPAGRRN